MNKEIIDMEPETLIARYLLGSATADEQRQLLEWLQSSEENRKQFMQLKRISNNCTNLNNADSYNVDAAISNFDRTRTIIAPKRNNIRRMILWSGSIAAALAVMVSIYILRPESNNFTLTAQTNNTRNEFKLADNSIVTLNKQAKLFTSKTFAAERTVKLTGEAYFSVTHDAEHPFVVETEDLTIKVLGTEFNVHPTTENNVIVTVETGRVMVMHDKQSIIITKGEQVTYNKEKHTLIKSINTNDNYNSWKTGVLYFNDTPLRSVINQLNQQYGVEFVIGSARLDSCQLNATFDFTDIKQVIELLSITLKVDIKEENNTLVLYERSKQ